MKTDRKTTVISTSDDVAALERDIRTHKRRRVGRLTLRVAGIDEAKQNRLALAINKGYFACGCAEATVLGLVGLIGAAAYAGSTGMIPDDWLKALGLGFGAFAVGVTLGKYAGKRIAGVKLAGAVKELREHFGPEELPAEKPTARCAVRADS